MTSRARTITTLAGAIMVLARGPSARAATDADLPAVVAVVAGLSPAGTLEAARGEMPARWRLEIVRPAAMPETAPEAAVSIDHPLRAYLDADFMQCLAELQRLSPNGDRDADRLLERGRRSETALVTTLAAACAFGAGDARQARDVVRRLVARELDAPELLRRTTPDFQNLVESERLSARQRGRVTVEIETEPPGGAVEVDGRGVCPSAPCRVRVVPGEHVLRAEGIGRRPHALTASIERDGSLTVSLALASADEAARQLGSFLASGRDPSSVEVMQAASMALGANLLVLAWRRGTETHASVYRRPVARPIHVTLEAADPDAAARAVRAALYEWKHGDVCVDAVRRDVAPSLVGGVPGGAPAVTPRTTRRRVFIWAAAAGAVVIGAAALFLAAHAPDPRGTAVEF